MAQTMRVMSPPRRVTQPIDFSELRSARLLGLGRKRSTRRGGNRSGFGAACRKQTVVHSGEASKQRRALRTRPTSAEVLSRPGRLKVERLDLFWTTSEPKWPTGPVALNEPLYTRLLLLLLFSKPDHFTHNSARRPLDGRVSLSALHRHPPPPLRACEGLKASGGAGVSPTPARTRAFNPPSNPFPPPPPL